MSYSVCAYLTDAKKVKSLFGCKDSSLYLKIEKALQDELKDLDDYFADDMPSGQNATAVLKDIMDGVIRFPDIPFMYGYVYEKICEYYGKQIYDSENIWELDEQSAFIPIPFSDDFPYIISIPKEELEEKKKQYMALEEGDRIGSYDYEEEMADLEDIFDEAIEKQQDLVIFCY